MTSKLERTTNLLALLLEARQPLTTEAILDALSHQYEGGPSAIRAAFERDKATLREIGVPIESQVLSGDQAGRTAYFIDRKRYELADLELSADEQRALHIAAAMARSSDAAFGVLKLGGDPAGNSAMIAEVPSVPALPVLHEAAARRCGVHFRYNDQLRLVHPYGLLLRDGFWYVAGFDASRDEQRTFRVDRIDGAVRIDEEVTFERPPGFEIGGVFPADAKEFGENPDARASVRVDAPLAWMVRQELGPEAVTHEHADGAIDVDVACANLDAFRAWLFSLGGHAEVLGPPSVRLHVVDWLSQLAGRA